MQFDRAWRCALAHAIRRGRPAIFLVVWTFIVAIGVDNVLKPILIGKSSHVPFILIMLGGPTLLAVAHAAIRDWIEAKADDEAATAAGVRTAAIPGSREYERLS